MENEERKRKKKKKKLDQIYKVRGFIYLSQYYLYI